MGQPVLRERSNARSEAWADDDVFDESGDSAPGRIKAAVVAVLIVAGFGGGALYGRLSQEPAPSSRVGGVCPVGGHQAAWRWACEADAPTRAASAARAPVVVPDLPDVPATGTILALTGTGEFKPPLAEDATFGEDPAQTEELALKEVLALAGPSEPMLPALPPPADGSEQPSAQATAAETGGTGIAGRDRAEPADEPRPGEIDVAVDLQSPGELDEAHRPRENPLPTQAATREPSRDAWSMAPAGPMPQPAKAEPGGASSAAARERRFTRAGLPRPRPRRALGGSPFEAQPALLSELLFDRPDP